MLYFIIIIESYKNLSSGASTLIDVFTDAHLSCIESFKDGIGSPSSLQSLDNFAESKQSSFDLYNEDIDEMIYPQSVNEEMIVYQFAGLTKKVYEKIGKGKYCFYTSNIYLNDCPSKYFSLGFVNQFDMTSSIQELRLNNWISPVE